MQHFAHCRVSSSLSLTHFSLLIVFNDLLMHLPCHKVPIIHSPLSQTSKPSVQVELNCRPVRNRCSVFSVPLFPHKWRWISHSWIPIWNLFPSRLHNERIITDQRARTKRSAIRVVSNNPAGEGKKQHTHTQNNWPVGSNVRKNGKRAI